MARTVLKLAKFDAELTTTPCNARNNADLKLTLRLGFRQINPAGGAATGTYNERKFWERTIGRLKQDEGDLARAMALTGSSGAVADTLARARHYGARAKDALGPLPDSPAKAILLETVDVAIARAF